MDLVINRFTVSILVVGCLVAWFLQLIALSPISPNPLILKHSYTREGPYAKNNVLQAVEKLGEGMLDRPEDTAVDSQGLIYSQGWLDKTYAFKWVMGRLEDGWRRSSRPYCKHEWRCSCLYAQPDYVFNMRIDTLQIQDIQLLAEKLMEMHIKLGFKWVFATVRLRLMSLVFIRHIILQGLLKVNDDQLFLLASKIDGVPIRFANTVVEASDGSVYFSDSSTKYEKFFLDLLEAKPYGRLLKYDPITKKTTVLLDGLGFANGVALSSKEDYIIICETWKFRCLKHWIKGEKLGSTEIFIENLPGGPDNINIAADGRSYWIALVGRIRSRTLEFVYRYGILKHIFATYPNLLEWIGFQKRQAMVVKVGEHGQPITSLDDSNGKVMSLVTSAMEVGDYLYLGSLHANFLGRLSADKFRV